MGFGERGSEGISSGCTRDCTRCGECESPGISAGDFTCIMYNTDIGGWRLACIPSRLAKVCVDRLLLYLHEAAVQVVYRYPGEVLSSSSNHLTI